MTIINPHDSATWPIGYSASPVDSREPCPMNDAQERALRAVYDRQALDEFAHRYEANPARVTRIMSWETFRKSATPGFGMDCIMVYWCGMYLGIETDGYTHS
jgi:hypothetical protein